MSLLIESLPFIVRVISYYTEPALFFQHGVSQEVKDVLFKAEDKGLKMRPMRSDRFMVNNI
jgi:hypothetical protein